ncbi:hypothetical protein NKH37_08135 [Mesorhizobium sp. M1217]
MRQSAEDIEEPVDRADRGTAANHHRDHNDGGGASMKAQRANDGSQRKVRADGEIDAACQDDQMLAHRHNRDDGRLGEDVAEIASCQEIG